MKLSVQAMALAGAIVTAVFFAVCVFLVAVVPETVRFIGFVFHLDLTGISRAPTWASSLVGVAFLAVYVGLFGGILAAVYNRLAKS